jgi:DDE superfamily endonuclease
LDGYTALDGDRTLKTLMNFTLQEFNGLWALVENDVINAWTMGRGRKPKTSGKDAFFIGLVVLKHFNTWEMHAIDFGILAPTLEKMTHRVLEMVEPVLYKLLVKPVTMTDQRAKYHEFEHFPCALYATDVKFQPSYRPSGRFAEQKQYFSGKHKQYGLKIECSVAPPGVAVDVSAHYVGSTSDLTMFRAHEQKHKRMLKKGPDEAVMSDVGERWSGGAAMWAVLADKGYQGYPASLRVILPKRKPAGRELEQEDMAKNADISSDRVLVENYFGRLSSLWKVMYVTFKWNESRFDCVSRLCVALTNYHTGLMPLRAQDATFYKSVLARYHSMGEEQRKRRRDTQQEYVQRQRARFAVSEASRRGDEEEEDSQQSAVF